MQGDFVVEKGEDDPSAGVQASVPLTRTGVVRSVNASERTCGVAWSKVEAGHPSTIGAQSASNRVDSSSSSTSEPGIIFGSGTDAVFSVYELMPHPDFSFRGGLPVLRLNTNSGAPLLAPIEPVTDAPSVTAADTAEGNAARGSDGRQDGDAQSSNDTESGGLPPETSDSGIFEAQMAIDDVRVAKDAAEDAEGGDDDDDDDDDADAVPAATDVDDDDDSSDWETDEDEDPGDAPVHVSATDDSPAMYGEELEVCEESGHVRV